MVRADDRAVARRAAPGGDATHHAEIGRVAAGAAVAVPVAVYLLVLWLLHRRPGMPGTWMTPLGALFVLATPWTPHPVLATGLLLAGLLATKLTLRRRAMGQTAQGAS